METINNQIVNQLLEKPYWVIDILPYQVPVNSPGQYFKVEQFYLHAPQINYIHKKFANVLLKLNCYYDYDMLTHDGEWLHLPVPEELYDHVTKCPDNFHNLIILTHDHQAMFTINGDDTYMTVYNPGQDLLSLLKELSTSEGLFLWEPPKEQD